MYIDRICFSIVVFVFNKPQELFQTLIIRDFSFSNS